jgi:hypothetical protein
MPTDRAIKMHLSLYNVDANAQMTFFSGFTAGLRDARKFTGRDQSTGTKINGEKIGDHGSWLGAIGYMAILDQIGTCFKPKSVTTINRNTIFKALKYFSQLPDLEIDALYALRCAFAHDYSLYNINPNKPNLTHHFAVCQSPALKPVTLPQNQWDGDYSKKNLNNRTLINLETFGNTVELVCAKLIEHANNNDIEIVLTNGSDELLQRYSFYSSDKFTMI